MARRAFLVGINEYRQSQFNLRGCVNDINSLQSLLTSRFDFLESDITTVVDNQATRENILAGLTALVQGAAAGDVLVFGFSGHGTQKIHVDESEIDGKDECIVPYELDFVSLISDDDINNIITPNIPPDGSIRFTAIYDSCHSGTLEREIFRLFTGEEETLVINRTINASVFWPMDLPSRRDVSIGPYDILSACADNETAADLANVEGVPRGAFSYALHRTIEETSDIRIADLEETVLNRIRQVSRHTQNPQYIAFDSSRRVFG